MSDEQKHTVTTDALYTLGTIIDETAERDAIHLAVEPMIAGEYLVRGQRIRIEGKFAFDAMDREPDAVAIVDPFLDEEGVSKGQRFWAIVLPRTITSLRHVWSHPAFPEAGAVAAPAPTNSKEASKAWITTFANSVGMTYDTLMDGAERYVKRGDYVTGGSELEGEYVPDEFWFHYCHVTGKEVPADQQDNFFSCAC